MRLFLQEYARECRNVALDLSNCNLSPEIRFLIKLRVLVLEGNQISAIPPEIGSLTDLRILNLKSNRISSIPPAIYSLPKLEMLHLSQNRLSRDYITSMPRAALEYLAGLDLDLGCQALKYFILTHRRPKQREVLDEV